MNLDDLEIYRLTRILEKLSWKAPTSAFTPEERDLIRRLRDHKEEVLAHLYAISKDAIARNDRGRERLLALIRGIERICD